MFFVVYLGILLDHIGRWFDCIEQRHKDEYLAGASDLADLEHRMRVLERDGFPR